MANGKATNSQCVAATGATQERRRKKEEGHAGPLNFLVQKMFRIFKGEGVDDLVMASSPSNSSLTGQLSARFAVPAPSLFARSHLEQRPLAATHLLLLSFFFFFLWSAEGADLHEPGRGVGVGEPLQIPPYHWVRQRALPWPFGANQNEQANRRQGLLLFCFFLIYDARPLAKG
jgi:hypothetical protein